MKVYNSSDEIPTPPSGSVVTVGNFDGVHLGHQAVISHAGRLAHENSLPLIVMTFDPAPVRLLRPDRAPGILTPSQIKTKLIGELEPDQLLIVKTTRDFLSLSPAEFVERILVDRLAVRHIVEGTSFNFGSSRAGRIESLEKMAARFGFQCHSPAPFTVTLDHQDAPTTLSSTLIRSLVSTSQFNMVRQCLRRDYIIAAHIVPGRGRGRQLGFPTANLELLNPDQLIPADGVFAGYARLGDDFDSAWRQNRSYPAAISIGRCQTFSDGRWQIEAHLLDDNATPFDESGRTNLPGKCIILSFIERIRDQQRFDSQTELIRTIEADCQKINDILTRQSI